MRLKKDQMSSLFLVLVAGVVIVLSVKAGLGSFQKPGSGLFPFLSACLMTVLSLPILIISTLGRAREEKPIFARSEVNWGNIIRTVAALFAFPLVYKVLGFNVTVFGFMLFLAKAIEPRRWIVAILFALITTIVSYVMFVYWLGFYFEKGILGI